MLASHMSSSRILRVAGLLGLRGRSGFFVNAVRRVLDRAVEPQPQVFSIGIYAGSSPLTLEPSPAASNPVITAADVTDVDADFVADPFMLRTDAGWFMFFEVMNAAAGRGEIAYAHSDDGFTWSYGSVVLREAFHLSYPYVLEHGGEVYRIPESFEDDGVYLYRATDFPTDWERIGRLLPGPWLDTSVFEHDGLWWAYCSDQPNGGDGNLHLFFASDLLGPWNEHPASPLFENDFTSSRPAGRVRTVDGLVVRFAQNCRPDYGTSVGAFGVDELTVETYSERSLSDGPLLAGRGEGWNANGMHHVDAHELGDGTWIACVDGLAVVTGSSSPAQAWSEPG